MLKFLFLLLSLSVTCPRFYPVRLSLRLLSTSASVKLTQDLVVSPTPRIFLSKL